MRSLSCNAKKIVIVGFRSSAFLLPDTQVSSSASGIISAEASIGHNGIVKDNSLYPCILHLSCSQISPSQISSDHIGTSKISINQFGVGQIGSIKAGMTQVSSTQIDTL